MNKYIISLLFIFQSINIFSNDLKNVIFVPIYNASGNADFNYLSASITDAAKKMLHERFAFHETKQTVWEAVLNKKFFKFPNEYYSKSVAMQNGLLNGQDLVITGSYRVKKKKKRKKHNSSFVLYTNIVLLDINKKKVLANFTIKSGIDSYIFDSIEKMAERIANEAKSVLPSKKGFGKGNEFRGPKNNLLIKFGSNFKSPGNNNNNSSLDNLNSIYPSDFNFNREVSFEYRRLKFIYRNLSLFFSADLAMNENEFSVPLDKQKALGEYFGISTSIGPGYFFPVSSTFYIFTSLGAGYLIANANMDYSNLDQAPLDTRGETISTDKQNLNYFFADLNLQLGYNIYKKMAIETGIKYRQFFSEIYSSEFHIQIGTSFKM